MNDLIDIFKKMIDENKNKITVILLMEIINDLSDLMIESISRETDINYENLESHFKSAKREIEKKIKKQLEKNAN